MELCKAIDVRLGTLDYSMLHFASKLLMVISGIV